MTRLLPAPIFKSHLLAKAYANPPLKTQTRRVAKPQPKWMAGATRVYADKDYKKAWEDVPGCQESDGYADAPYGAPGDFWYFREGLGRDEDEWAYYRLDDQPVEIPNEGTKAWTWQNQYLPSIHMPRDCARRFARVTNVRVERVQDISTTDCWAEGIPSSIDVDPRHEFAELWDSINAKRGFSWESNPYVWCYAWELVERDAIPAEAWVK